MNKRFFTERIWNVKLDKMKGNTESWESAKAFAAAENIEQDSR